MELIADLHVHSRYSRATSPEMSPEGLWRWSQLKGISVVGTGDFTHPAWIGELREKLVPAGNGLFTLREPGGAGEVPASCASEVFFCLQAEISSIYKKNGRTRKVHSIVLAPGMREAELINRRLSAVGNIASDGRPILGLDAKALLEIVLGASPDAMLIPAHAWTPHFSVFGAASGFDSLEECFEELTPHIHAIETGLSSDPPMNRRWSALDGITLVSNSDAHSPRKLGREANVFRTELSYGAVAAALRTGEGFGGTLEFFPEEGKYHLDGHRKCGVRLTPEETVGNNYLCPSCGGKLTVGVMHRVARLADRAEPEKADFSSIIPLAELIAECEGRGVNTLGVQKKYLDLLSKLGPELKVLLEVPADDISSAGGERIAQAVERMRAGEIHISPGFDGEYGRIRVFDGDGADLPGAGVERAPRRRKQGGLY
ncbi:MAG: endonuclease Q family protein [Nitrospirota bacterium]|jgi:uncharacterized protein (TIGR00375 family)